MQSLGHTRSARYPDHLLQTPDTFVRAPLPGMRGVTAIVHAAPAIGAKFTQYTAEFEPQGTLAPIQDQRFVYALEGTIEAPGLTLKAGDYAWFPPGADVELRAASAARAAVIEKPYLALPGIAPPACFKGSKAKSPRRHSWATPISKCAA